MFGSNTLGDELQALKVDLSRLLNTSADDIFDQSKNQAEAIADQIKAALGDLGEVLSDEEAQLTRFVFAAPGYGDSAGLRARSDRWFDDEETLG